MTYHRKFLCLVSLIFCLTNAYSQLSKKIRPNIIYILSDDLNWGDIHPYGQKLMFVDGHPSNF